MQAVNCGGSIQDHGGDTSERHSILRNMAQTVHGEAALFTACLKYSVDGIIRVSGMLLIMRGFVRKNPDKWRMRALYRAEKLPEQNLY
jgi:hypothetical protein